MNALIKQFAAYLIAGVIFLTGIIVGLSFRDTNTVDKLSETNKQLSASLEAARAEVRQLRDNLDLQNAKLYSVYSECEEREREVDRLEAIAMRDHKELMSCAAALIQKH